MDLNNPVIKLCVAGSRAEFEGKVEEACRLYQEAWATARDDYEMCVAAHYVARHQQDPQDRLHWHREALVRADLVGDERVASFYPSLYVNMGYAYEVLGDEAEAKRYYDRATELGLVHSVE